MYLENSTPLNDKILLNLSKQAGYAVGTKIKHVLVIVKPANQTHGIAFSSRWNIGKKLRDKYNNKKINGIIKVFIDKYIFSNEYNRKLDSRFKEDTKSIYKLIAHELRHVTDDQRGIKSPRSEYRKRWKNRKHERRAIRGEKIALKKLESNVLIQEMVMALSNDISEINGVHSG